MNPIKEHQRKNNLEIPYECNGFEINDYVTYNKDGKIKRGYILCFRRFGYNWFAWIYFDKKTLLPEDCIFVEELSKIEEE